MNQSVLVTPCIEVFELLNTDSGLNGDLTSLSEVFTTERVKTYLYRLNHKEIC